MSKILFELSIRNLTTLHSQDGKPLRSSDFFDKRDDPSAETKKVISFLLKEELIETENQPDEYYLTTEAYDLIENDQLSYFLMDALDVREEDLYTDNEKSRELSYQIIEAEKKEEKPPLLSKAHPWLIYVLFLLVIYLLYFVYLFVFN